ncbi:hypothetical protein [Alienimonas californiensis]|nr:hypothetical protein [Alienimonas californiensis]
MNAASKAGQPWAEDEEAMLLTMTDAEFAKATGRTTGAADSRRRKLGLPNSYRTFGPEGTRVSPEAAKALTNCVNALQRVVTEAAAGLAKGRAGADGEPPVIQVSDVDAVRRELFAVLPRGLVKSTPGLVAALVKKADCDAGASKPKAGRRRAARSAYVGI